MNASAPHFRLFIERVDDDRFVSTLRSEEKYEFICWYSSVKSPTESAMECLGWCLSVLRHDSPQGLPIADYPEKWQTSPEIFAQEVYLKYVKNHIKEMYHRMSNKEMIVF